MAVDSVDFFQWPYDPMIGNTSFTAPALTVAVLTDIDICNITGYPNPFTVVFDIDGIPFLMLSAGQLSEQSIQWHGRRTLQPGQVLTAVGHVATQGLGIFAGGYLYT